MRRFHMITNKTTWLIGLVVGIVTVSSTLGWSSTQGDGRVIETVAGAGLAGYSGDGGSAVNAQIREATGLAVDADGNVYFADTNNHIIRRIDRRGIITTVAGTPTQSGFAGEGGPATAAKLATPTDVAVAPDGSLYIADNGNHVVRRIDRATGVINTVAGTPNVANFTGDGGLATAATLRSPSSVAVDRLGNLYIADSFNYRIRRVDAVTRVITTIAGSGARSVNTNDTGDGGSALLAKFRDVKDIVITSVGDILVADFSNNRVRRISPDGIITTIAGNGVFNVTGPEQLGDGSVATEAVVRWPSGLTLDGLGNLYIAENGSHRIRRVNAEGRISTVAGSGDPRIPGCAGDGGPAAEAQLNGPTSVVTDAAGNVYLSDSRCFRIRVVRNQ